jgi:hypothetical protein
VLNFVGEISKILLGTMTQSDAKEYNEHISQLEKEQRELLHISSEQMTVIKSAIQSVDSIIQKVDKNETLLMDTILKLNERVANATTLLQSVQSQCTNDNSQEGMPARVCGVNRCPSACGTRDVPATVYHCRAYSSRFNVATAAKWTGLS